MRASRPLIRSQHTTRGFSMGYMQPEGAAFQRSHGGHVHWSHGRHMHRPHGGHMHRPHGGDPHLLHGARQLASCACGLAVPCAQHHHSRAAIQAGQQHFNFHAQRQPAHRRSPCRSVGRARGQACCTSSSCLVCGPLVEWELRTSRDSSARRCCARKTGSAARVQPPRPPSMTGLLPALRLAAAPHSSGLCNGPSAIVAVGAPCGAVQQLLRLCRSYGSTAGGTIGDRAMQRLKGCNSWYVQNTCMRS
eukprot:366496-Chlamydomonas_euryale.AAC.19